VKSIIHVSTAHNFNDIRIFKKELKSLSKKYNCYFVVPHHEKVSIDNIHIIPIKRYKSRLLRFTLTNLEAFYQSIKINGKIVHFHDPDFFLFGIVLKLFGKKVIFDIHENYVGSVDYKNYLGGFGKKIVRNLFIAMNKLVSLTMDYLIIAHDTLHSDYRKDKIEVINNYPLLDELRRSDNFKKKDNISYHGMITKNRGFLELIDVAKKTNTKLDLCGNFESQDLQNEYEKNKSFVNYYGFVGREKIDQIIDNSFCGIVNFHRNSNHTKCYPNKLFEFLGKGIPVVASNFTIWMDLLEEHNCCIFVDPTDTNDIVKQVEKLKLDKELCYSMGNNGYDAIEKYFNWGIEERKLIKIYESLI